MAAGILPAVEPGILPGGEGVVDQIGLRSAIGHSPGTGCIVDAATGMVISISERAAKVMIPDPPGRTGWQDATLHGSQDGCRYSVFRWALL